MRAVVVYESMYGNTHRIADAIGAGLEAAFDVRVVPVSHAGPEVIADADLVVVGGPTHVHGMSRASTRKAAVEAADKPIGGLTVEPDALGPGLREWFGSLGDHPVRAAAFDTRVHGPAALTGRAAKGVSRLLRQHGFDVVAEPESFLVTKQDRLEPQEQDRARDWGASDLAGRIGRCVLRIAEGSRGTGCYWLRRWSCCWDRSLRHWLRPRPRPVRLMPAPIQPPRAWLPSRSSAARSRIRPWPLRWPVISRRRGGAAPPRWRCGSLIPARALPAR